MSKRLVLINCELNQIIVKNRKVLPLIELLWDEKFTGKFSNTIGLTFLLHKFSVKSEDKGSVEDLWIQLCIFVEVYRVHITYIPSCTICLKFPL
jgi:hypothetical protein